MHISDQSSAESRPWWARSKQEQKQGIEEAIEWYLSDVAELRNRDKLLLREAISAAFRGMFGLAAQAIYDLTVPEERWAAPVDDAAVDGITRETLRRALTALQTAEVQNPPVFR